MSESELATSVTYTIKPDGWGICDVCKRKQIKGGSNESTARLLAAHLLTTHSIKVDVDGDIVADDDDSGEFESPLFIPPRRNGTAVTTPTRMDYGSRWV